MSSIVHVLQNLEARMLSLWEKSHKYVPRDIVLEPCFLETSYDTFLMCEQVLHLKIPHLSVVIKCRN